MKKKILTFLFFYILTTLILMLTSCTGDNISDDNVGNNLVPSASNSWIEPFHTMGGTTEDVKRYMELRMNDLPMSELSSEYSIQLVYSKPDSAEGIMYSFAKTDGGLYSVIDTERKNVMPDVLEYLQNHYTSIMTMSQDEYMFTNESYDIIINVTKISDYYFNVNYSFVSL